MLLSLGSVALLPAQSTPPPVPLTPPDGYTLVWSDEFDSDGAPNPQNWTFENGFVRNQELQWYQPQNARVEKGLLVIEGRREHQINPRYEAGSADWRRARQAAEYTSASLMTRGLQAWQYGYFEMRARIDARDGLWPAWWTLGASGAWPRNGEIDIMEYLSRQPPRQRGVGRCGARSDLGRCAQAARITGRYRLVVELPRVANVLGRTIDSVVGR